MDGYIIDGFLVIVAVVVVMVILLAGKIRSEGASLKTSTVKMPKFSSSAIKEFRGTPHGEHVLNEYRGRERKYFRRSKKAQKKLDKALPGTLRYYLAARSSKKNSDKLRETVKRKRTELGIMSAVFGSPSHRSRVSGNSVSHGIRRDKHGTSRYSHLLVSKIEPKKNGGKNGK